VSQEAISFGNQDTYSSSSPNVSSRPPYKGFFTDRASVTADVPFLFSVAYRPRVRQLRIGATMPVSHVTTSLLPPCRAAASSSARAMRSFARRPSPSSTGLGSGVRCHAATPPPPEFPDQQTTPAELPGTDRPPSEVPGTNRPPDEFPSIDTPPEFNAPPGVDVPMPGLPVPGPELPGPAMPSPPAPEIPTVPPNPDVPPPQPPEVDPPRPPPEVVPPQPPGAATVLPPFV